MTGEYDIIERGDIHFYIRPHFKVSQVSSQTDIEHFFFVLSHQDLSKNRIFIVPKKSMPSNIDKELYFAYSDIVTKDPALFACVIKGEKYSAHMQEDKILAPAYSIADGKYFLVSHKGYTHLVYILHERRKKDVTCDLVLPSTHGNYIMMLLHPNHPQNFSKGLSQEKKAHFPKELAQQFANSAMLPLNNVKLLDYQGVEVLLVGCATEIDTSVLRIRDCFSTFPYNRILKELEQSLIIYPAMDRVKSV